MIQNGPRPIVGGDAQTRARRGDGSDARGNHLISLRVMKVAILTAGTGGSFCGTCLRDQALAKNLRALGHDAVVVPMYLPLQGETDEQHETELFFGGINAYLMMKSRLFRHTPRFIDKIFDSASLLRKAASRVGMTSPTDLGEMTCAMIKGEHGPQKKEYERLGGFLGETLKPDAVFLSNALLCGCAPTAARTTGAPVVCVLNGEDKFLDGLPPPYREEAWALLRDLVEDVDMFIGVSRYYADVMNERLEIPAEKSTVIYNGIDTSGYENFETHERPPTIGFLSQLIPAKGVETLIDAFIEMKRRDTVPGLRLSIAGSTVPDAKDFLAKIEKKISRSGFGKDVELRTDISRDEKIRFMHAIDVLCVPCTYGESFGLYVIEAMAAGTPVLLPRSGAFPELVEATGGGVIYDHEDAGALVRELRTVLADTDRLTTLGKKAKQSVSESFTAETMAGNYAELFGRLARKS